MKRNKNTYSRNAVSILAFAIILLFTTSSQLMAQVSVLTQHNDIGRTGANLNETQLTTSNVKVGTFGKLFSLQVDGQIYAQPLYVPNLEIVPGSTPRNVLFIVTSHNNVYAFDADGRNHASPYWSRNLGAYVPSSVIGTVNILDGVGAIGTPVIDPAAGCIYICNKIYNSATSGQTYQLHSLNLLTGKDQSQSPVSIHATIHGTGIDSVGGAITFKANKHLNRPGLLLLKGVIYIGFGSHEDIDPYHGWVIAYDAKTFAQVGVYCTTPNGTRGGIWQGGQGLASDGTYIYFQTGNGSSDVQNGNKGASDCFCKLQLVQTGSLILKDWFLVHDYDYLNQNDVDLGSGGSVILPGNQWIIGGGKEGVLYLTKTSNLGNFSGSTSSDPQIQQEFNAWNGVQMGGPAVWNSPANGLRVYVWTPGDVMHSYLFNPSSSTFNITPVSQGTITAANGNAVAAALSVSANQDTPGSAIVWATSPTSDTDQSYSGGTLYAFDARDVSKELYDTHQSASDDFGNWAKFSPPTVVNGKVYVATSSNQVVAYGILPTPSQAGNVKGVAGNTRAYLSWDAAQYAESYTVRRSTSPTGTFTAVSTKQATTTFVDTKLINGQAYYYSIVAVNNAGSSSPTTPIAVTPSSSAPSGTIISLNFIGGGPNGTPSPLAANESAGVVSSINWNNASGVSGTISSLYDSIDLPTGSSANWSSSGTWSLPTSQQTSNFRMMNGYLDPQPGGPATVTINNIPSDFVTKGYSVYVYYAGDTSENRNGLYTIGSTTISAGDTANSVFTGTFTQASNGSFGNYVVFTGLNTNSITLTATPDTTVGSQPRSPVNGLQIVRNP